MESVACQERWRTRPEPIDPAQDLGESGAWHRDFGQLERDVAAVMHNHGADRAPASPKTSIPTQTTDPPPGHPAVPTTEEVLEPVADGPNELFNK